MVTQWTMKKYSLKILFQEHPLITISLENIIWSVIRARITVIIMDILWNLKQYAL